MRVRGGGSVQEVGGGGGRCGLWWFRLRVGLEKVSFVLVISLNDQFLIFIFWLWVWVLRK